MIVSYKSTDYRPLTFYVRRSRRTEEPLYDYCEVGKDRRYDMLQGRLESKDIVQPIRQKADELAGQVYGWVEIERVL